MNFKHEHAGVINRIGLTKGVRIVSTMIIDREEVKP
jgi:hypothetical protein